MLLNWQRVTLRTCWNRNPNRIHLFLGFQCYYAIFSSFFFFLLALRRSPFVMFVACQTHSMYLIIYINLGANISKCYGILKKWRINWLTWFRHEESICHRTRIFLGVFFSFWRHQTESLKGFTSSKSLWIEILTKIAHALYNNIVCYGEKYFETKRKEATVWQGERATQTIWRKKWNRKKEEEKSCHTFSRNKLQHSDGIDNERETNTVCMLLFAHIYFRATATIASKREGERLTAWIRANEWGSTSNAKYHAIGAKWSTSAILTYRRRKRERERDKLNRNYRQEFFVLHKGIQGVHSDSKCNTTANLQ